MRPQKIATISDELKHYLQAADVKGRNVGSSHGTMFMASWPGHSTTVFISDDLVWGCSNEEILTALKAKF